jgi:hypothetical protein
MRHYEFAVPPDQFSSFLFFRFRLPSVEDGTARNQPMNTKNTGKSIPWLLYAVTLVGCAYVLTYVFLRLARLEAEDSTVAVTPARTARPCLELTGDEGAVRDGSGRILGSVRNNCEKQFRNVEVEFKLYNSSGEVVGAAATSEEALGPYESWKFEMIAMQPYARYQLARVTGD